MSSEVSSDMCDIPADSPWLQRLETLCCKQKSICLLSTSPPLLPLTHPLYVKWLNYLAVGLNQTQSYLTGLRLGFPTVPHTAKLLGSFSPALPYSYPRQSNGLGSYGYMTIFHLYSLLLIFWLILKLIFRSANI